MRILILVLTMSLKTGPTTLCYFFFQKKPLAKTKREKIIMVRFRKISLTLEKVNLKPLIFVGFLIICRYIFEIYKSISAKKYINPFSAIAHMALGLLLISISLNSVLSSERAMSIKIDQEESYKDLTIYFQNINVSEAYNYDAIEADLLVQTKNGKSFLLSPEKRRYFTRGQITTETAIHASLLRDIYMTIGDQLDDGSWVVNIQINYLIRWIWFSALLMCLAGMMLIFTKKRSRQ